jgi:hypothetical protein
MDYELIIEKLYEFMKGECNNTNHSGKAIYFCLNNQCEKKYLCSECLIEDVEHFTNHLKTLVPLDNKAKFSKFLDLGDFKEINTSNSGVRDEVRQIYSKIKDKCISYIDEHMENNFEKYVNRLEQQLGKDSNRNSLNEINRIIDNYITINRKDKFNDFYDELNKIIIVEKDNKLNRNKTSYQINDKFIQYKLNDIFTEQFCKSNLQQPLVTLAEETESEFDKSFVSIKEEIMETLGDNSLNATNDGNRSQAIKSRLSELKQRLGKI